MLLYRLQYGAVEEEVKEQCRRFKKPLPKEIAEAPELEPALTLFLNAFWDLRSCAPSGWGPGRIPWTATKEYANELGLVGELRADFFHHVGNLDAVYLAEVAEKPDRKGAVGKKNEGKERRTPRRVAPREVKRKPVRG